jgi:hypothetical protein
VVHEDNDEKFQICVKTNNILAIKDKNYIREVCSSHGENRNV